jgi:hypothetical protein
MNKANNTTSPKIPIITSFMFSSKDLEDIA